MKKEQHVKPKGFYIYGRNVVEETLAAAPDRVAEVFVVKEAKGDYATITQTARQLEIRVTTIDQRKADHLFGDVGMQGIGAYYTGFQYATFEDVIGSLDADAQASIVIVDGVEDVQNFGAIIRSAAAVGAAAVCVPSHKQAPVNGATFKTSVGTVHKIPIVQFVGINQMIADAKKHDFWVYGIDMEDDATQYPAGTIWDQKYDTRTAFVVGAEGGGLSQKAHENCDFITPIPMENNVESLNVSVATAVALYEWKRQMTKTVA